MKFVYDCKKVFSDEDNKNIFESVAGSISTADQSRFEADYVRWVNEGSIQLSSSEQETLLVEQLRAGLKTGSI